MRTALLIAVLVGVIALGLVIIAAFVTLGLEARHDNWHDDEDRK